jgi:hypothetical protein
VLLGLLLAERAPQVDVAEVTLHGACPVPVALRAGKLPGQN